VQNLSQAQLFQLWAMSLQCFLRRVLSYFPERKSVDREERLQVQISVLLVMATLASVLVEQALQFLLPHRAGKVPCELGLEALTVMKGLRRCWRRWQLSVDHVSL
jgi:hypothetical protein